MHIPSLFDKLHDLDERDYQKAGLVGNPAYSGLRREDNEERFRVHIPREALESKVSDSISRFFNAKSDKDIPSNLYLFSRDGGAGKSHTIRRMHNFCREKNFLFAEIEEDDLHQGNIKENLMYIMKLMNTEKMVVFLECDKPSELYQQLCQVDGVYIVGSGHEPDNELKKASKKFDILDLEKDYPLTKSQLLEVMKRTMDKVILGNEQIIDEEVLKEISENTNSPGDALNALGVCLAIYAYKAKQGEEYKITVEDARQWSYRNMPKD